MTGTVILHLPTGSLVPMARDKGNALFMQDTVHMVLCATDPSSSDGCSDFLAAIAKARALVAAGARRIIFLIGGGSASAGLRRSLHSFSRNAGRAVAGKQVVFDTRILTGSDQDRVIAQAIDILHDNACMPHGLLHEAPSAERFCAASVLR
ncbi:MAG: hypothetical protein ACK4MS_07645 [Paracoccaceae bacterium]